MSTSRCTKGPTAWLTRRASFAAAARTVDEGSDHKRQEKQKGCNGRERASPREGFQHATVCRVSYARKDRRQKNRQEKRTDHHDEGSRHPADEQKQESSAGTTGWS